MIQGSNAWRVTLATLRAMRRPFEVRSRWREVSLAAFEALLREYPRPLEPDARLTTKPRRAEWVDASWGDWPASAVARCWMQRPYRVYQIRSV